jgi:hypothetical protein
MRLLRAVARKEGVRGGTRVPTRSKIKYTYPK